MKRSVCSAILCTLLAFAGVGLFNPSDSELSAQSDPHAYFNMLVRRSDHWKSFSLRDPAQLANRSLGGYWWGSTGEPSYVTYDPASDDDRHRQDAAKVVVPAFFQSSVLTQPLTSSGTLLTVDYAYKSIFPPGRVIKIDQEIMTVVAWQTTTTATVARAAFGTSAQPHAVGAAVMHSTNSLRGTVRLPLGTEDGRDYFFVWDGYWTDSFIGAGPFNHKAFQFSSGSQDGDAIWLEPNVSHGYDRRGCWNPAVHVGKFRMRSYNRPGGDANWSLTDGNMLGPSAIGGVPLGPSQEFCYEANTWLRFFVHLRQKSNDYDTLNMWVADETREAVQVLFDVPISVRPTGATPNSISRFWLEFNSSEDDFMRLDGRNLVAYVRNFVALRDVADPRSLLVRPVAGAVAPASGPEPPTNVRIVR